VRKGEASWGAESHAVKNLGGVLRELSCFAVTVRGAPLVPEAQLPLLHNDLAHHTLRYYEASATCQDSVIDLLSWRNALSAHDLLLLRKLLALSIEEVSGRVVDFDLDPVS